MTNADKLVEKVADAIIESYKIKALEQEHPTLKALRSDTFNTLNEI